MGIIFLYLHVNSIPVQVLLNSAEWVVLCYQFSVSNSVEQERRSSVASCREGKPSRVHCHTSSECHRMGERA